MRAAAFALLLALGAPAIAADEPVPAAEQAEAPVRVVIFDRLMEGPPAGLAMLNDAAKALETEFKPASTEIEALAQQYDAAARAVQADEQAGTRDQARIDRANQLGSDLQRKSDDAAAAFEKRQAAVFDPLMQQIDQALQRYQGSGEVFMLGQQEFDMQPAGALTDETAAFVAWMAAQK